MNELYEKYLLSRQGELAPPDRQDVFRAGMLAAAEIAKNFEPDERCDYVLYPSDAIREAAK